LILLAVGTGCAPGSEPSGDPTVPSQSHQVAEHYVALGDSYTAGPLIPTTDLADGCLRSDHNYPALLAERLQITDVTDVSCSSAETRHLTHPQRTFGGRTVPPQLDAVDDGTDLVTLGIGGNDYTLFGTLVTTCADPTARATPCSDLLADRGIDLVARTEQISRHAATAIDEVRDRAPDATVVLVGYLRLVPRHHGCPELPFSPPDLRYADRVSRALDRALARAADRSGATYVDMYAASRGHDVCSADPWTNGSRTTQGVALAYHPLAAGMVAVTDRIEEALVDRS
jgi:lysophospholipase L1-like esterase